MLEAQRKARMKTPAAAEDFERVEAAKEKRARRAARYARAQAA
ncbi:MAG TPA: hypothetical protein VGS12_14590 [Caulobacteraceae bacterium]|nr:hypothetical protein [Caulobacteraceae bacterium]